MVDVKNNNSEFIKNLKISIENLSSQKNKLDEITEILIKKRENGNKIIIIGNGGSASTSSHFVSDLLKTSIVKNSKRFRAISLVDNIPVMTAWANDASYDDIFAEQLKNFLDPEDLIIAFSGSGKSENVIRAMKLAKRSNASVIGFTGMSGGSFPEICDICYSVPSDDMLIIESVHVMLCHSIISTIRNLGEPQFKYE
jgi:D-sedoheptulose 7-phosphate isomerase